MSGSNIQVPQTEITCNSIKHIGNSCYSPAGDQSILSEFEKLYNITSKVGNTKGFVEIGKEEPIHISGRNNLTYDSQQLANFKLTIEQSTLLDVEEPDSMKKLAIDLPVNQNLRTTGNDMFVPILKKK